MHRGWRKLRGLLGLTAVGGIAGGLLGGVGTAVASLVGTGGLHLPSIILGTGIWGGIGGTVAAGVGAFLAAGGPRDSLSELSPVRAGLVGLTIGVAVPFLVVAGIKFLMLGVAPSLTVSAAYGAVIGGVLGGALGSGVVTVAQRSEARRLEGPAATLLDGGE